MVRFKYKFKNYVYVLMVSAIVLALATIGMSVYRFIAFGYDPNKSLGVILSLLIAVFIIILIASILISSYYEVNQNDFILKWGILKNKIPVKEITRTIHNTDTNKLTVIYGKEDNFMVISVVDTNPLDIVDALRVHNKKIIYQSQSNESTSEKQDKK